MQTKLDCPFCSPEFSQTLSPLPREHPEHHIAALLRDGTKKFYHCSKCDGAFCRDKMTARWQLSPGTYARFVEEGIIADLVND